MIMWFIGINSNICIESPTLRFLLLLDIFVPCFFRGKGPFPFSSKRIWCNGSAMRRARAGGAMDFFRQLLRSGDFQPHGFCYRWNSGLVWLNVLSDALIALAYFTIPFTLLRFIRKRRDLPFSWMVALFGVFIIACGMTHVMEVWNLWHAQYWLAGIIKTITALASILTAILLVQLAEKRTLASRKSRSMVADYLGGRWGMASGSRPSFLTSRRARG